MKKLIYIAYIDRLNYIGVYKKILSECNVFRNYYETILICRESNSILVKNINFNDEVKTNNIFYLIESCSKKFMGIRKYKNLNIFNKFINNYIKINKPKVIYIRKYNLLSKGFCYIKNAKKILNCCVIYEIPTYPYKNELFNKGKYLSYLINTVSNYILGKLVDKITIVLGQNIELKSDKFVPISNGIDSSTIRLKDKTVADDCLNLIGVANISFWHGYDRLIEGLKDYYMKAGNKIPVYFHIVGNGAELSNLKKLIDSYNLNNYVVLYGNKVGEELDELFNKCNIGIGSLANHRKGLTKDSALKNREYCARGIPFLIASDDDGFSENFKYILKVDPDESPISICKIIQFYNSIKNDNYTEIMRSYAEQKLDWNSAMKPVLDVIKAPEKNNKRISWDNLTI